MNEWQKTLSPDFSTEIMIDEKRLFVDGRRKRDEIKAI